MSLAGHGARLDVATGDAVAPAAPDHEAWQGCVTTTSTKAIAVMYRRALPAYLLEFVLVCIMAAPVEAQVPPGVLTTPALGFARREIPVHDLANGRVTQTLALWLPVEVPRYWDQLVGGRHLGAKGWDDAQRAFEAGQEATIELVDVRDGRVRTYALGADQGQAARRERLEALAVTAPDVWDDHGLGRPSVTWLDTRGALLLGGRTAKDGRLVELLPDGTTPRSDATLPYAGPTWWSVELAEQEFFLGATRDALLRWSLAGGREVAATAEMLAAPHGWSEAQLHGKRVEHRIHSTSHVVDATWLVVIGTVADVPPPVGFIGSRGGPSGPTCETLAEVDARTGALVRRIRIDEGSPFRIEFPRSERGVWRGERAVAAVGWDGGANGDVGIAWHDGGTYRLEAVRLEGLVLLYPLGLLHLEGEPDGLMLCAVERPEAGEGYLLLRAP